MDSLFSELPSTASTSLLEMLLSALSAGESKRVLRLCERFIWVLEDTEDPAHFPPKFIPTNRASDTTDTKGGWSA